MTKSKVGNGHKSKCFGDDSMQRIERRGMRGYWSMNGECDNVHDEEWGQRQKQTMESKVGVEDETEYFRHARKR